MKKFLAIFICLATITTVFANPFTSHQVSVTDPEKMFTGDTNIKTISAEYKGTLSTLFTIKDAVNVAPVVFGDVGYNYLKSKTDSDFDSDKNRDLNFVYDSGFGFALKMGAGLDFNYDFEIKDNLILSVGITPFADLGVTTMFGKGNMSIYDRNDDYTLPSGFNEAIANYFFETGIEPTIEFGSSKVKGVIGYNLVVRYGFNTRNVLSDYAFIKVAKGNVSVYNNFKVGCKFSF